MTIFVISHGNGANNPPPQPDDWVSWEDRDKCPKCEKPYMKARCESHPRCDECCYNMHLRKQHLIVDAFKQ